MVFNTSTDSEKSKAVLVHLKIEGEVNYHSKTFAATATISFEFGEHARYILLEAVDFSIVYVELDNNLASYTYDKEKIKVEIPQKLRGEKGEVKVCYIVTDPKAGMHFISRERYGDFVQDQVWTTGEGQTKYFEVEEENKYWFPYVPGPGTKCTSETIITVPSPQEVISNGLLVKVDELGSKRRFHWKLDIIHSTYLISIIAGEFVSKNEQYRNVQLYYFVPKGRLQDIDRAFNTTKNFLEFFEWLTGVQYPFGRFTQTCVYGAPFGGMENITANTMTERMLHDEIAHIDYNSQENVGHHLAHQWFGDIVTCKTWEDVWLNESFAIFAYALYLDYKVDKKEYEYYYLCKIDTITETKKILGGKQVCSTYSENPRQSFGRYNIEKGSAVLNSLRNLVGSEILWKSIRRYFSEFKYSVASTRDFQNIITKTSKQDLSWFFDEYVYSAGIPELHVSYFYSNLQKAVQIKFEQTQQSRRVFSLRFRIAVNVGINDTKEEFVEIRERHETINISCNTKPKFICIDPDQSIVGKIDVEEDLDEIISKIIYDSHLSCRIRAIRRLEASNVKKTLQVLSNILEDKKEHWSVAYETAIILGSIISEDSFNILKKFCQHKNPKVRRGIVTSLGEFKTKQSYDVLQELYTKEVSYYIRGEILHSLGKTGQKDSIENLYKGLGEYSHGDIIALEAIKGLGKLGTEEACKELLRISQFSHVNKRRFAALEELTSYLNIPKVKSRILQMIEEDEHDIRDKAFEVALKSDDPVFVNSAKEKFISRHYVEYSMTWVA